MDLVASWSFSRHARVLSLTALILFAVSPAAAQPAFNQVCFGSTLSHGIAVADFDNDGDQDIALNPGQPAGLGFSFSTEIDVFLGNGDGTFAFAGQDSAAAAFLDLFAADVDNDGDQDLVASGMPASVLRGNGDGTFQAAESYASTSFSATIGDLNGDGFTDLITPDDTKSIIVRLNQGDGTFGAGDRVRIGDMVRTLTTTDFDGDGFLDVVVLLEGSPIRLRVLLGKGDGTFGHLIKTNLDAGAPGRDLAPADFNGDGNTDLAVAAYQGGGLVFLPGNGNGKFGSPTNYPMAGQTTRLDVGDFDGDGNDDIVAGNYFANFPTNGNVSILYGNGTGAFTIGTVIPVSFGNGVVAAHLNGDSNLDLVVDYCALLKDGTVASAAAAAALSQPTVTAAPTSLKAGVSPNPLQRQGTLGFSLPRGGKVSIHLYDVRGGRVHTLMDRTWLEAGNHKVRIDRKAAGLGTGMYFYRIETEESRKSGSIVVVDR